MGIAITDEHDPMTIWEEVEGFSGSAARPRRARRTPQAGPAGGPPGTAPRIASAHLERELRSSGARVTATSIERR